jgi:hypothetical protein
LCRVVEVDKNGYLSVIITIDNAKHLSPRFRSLSSLETWILDIDDRVPKKDYPLYTKDLYKKFFLFHFKGTIYDLKKQYVIDHKIQGAYLKRY